MKKSLAVLSLLIVFVLTAQLSHAAPLPPAPTDGAPLDSFIGVLIVLGVGYAIYYLRKNKSKTPAQA